MDNKLLNNNNEIEDGEIFSSSDNDDACEILENTKNTTTTTTTTTTTIKTTPFFPTVIKTDIEKNNTGVNKNLSEKTNNRVDRKRSHEKNSMNINSADESSQQYIFDDELNIFIRGGSPISNLKQKNYYESHPLYYDDISCDSDENFDKYSMYERKKTRKNKKSKSGNDKYKNKHRSRPQRFKNSSCIDNNNDQIIYKRKKLCKFFLHNKCYRPSQCVFMHGEFPCKYYYLGLKCPDDKNCKLDHGKPLNEDMKEALLRHIQYAPDECLGNFKKIPSEVADKLFSDRTMEFKLNEIQLNKTKLEELSSVNVYDNKNENKEKCNINIKENINKKLDEKNKSDDNNISRIKNSNQDISDDIFMHINKEFLNCDTYRMFLDDLNNKCNVEPLTKILSIENNTEKLPTNFNDIDERIKEKLKKSIESENYDDPNLKFFLIQFFLSLNNKTNINLNDIPQSLRIENFKEYLTEIQIDELKELGINFVHHLSLLSLANLNSLGISITQISQIQDKSLTLDNITTITSENHLDMIDNNTETVIDNCKQVSPTSADTDMRILPPVYSPDKWSGTVDTDCRALTPSLDANVNDLVIDEESELIIDESVLSDETSDISDDDLNLLQTDLKQEHQFTDFINENVVKDIDPIINFEKEEKANELKKQYSDFRTTKTKTVLEINDYDNTPELSPSPTELSVLHLIEQNMKKSIKYGDMDMRFPFLPIVNFLPATEIDASINVHEEIEYKVNEILIPEKKLLPSSILVKLKANHPDPRLRKEYFNREQLIINKKDPNIKSIEIEYPNNNDSNNINESNINNENNINNININHLTNTNKENQYFAKENVIIKNATIKILSAGIDPRKRFDIHSQISSEPSLVITKNLNHLTERNQQEKQSNSIQFLHFYLQKSNWYNDQNSKRKIEINELIAHLGKAINNFHQENIPNKQFNIFNLYHASKIDEILINLRIDIDCNGYIVEINRSTQNNNQQQQQQLQQQNNNDQNYINNAGIDVIYNNNLNINNNNNSQLYPMRFFKPPPLIPPLVPNKLLSSAPKPGLLGFAPGMPCDNTNLNLSSSFWCPPSARYYHKNSHNSNFQQQKLYTNFFQRNHRKFKDRI